MAGGHGPVIVQPNGTLAEKTVTPPTVHLSSALTPSPYEQEEPEPVREMPARPMTLAVQPTQVDRPRIDTQAWA
jgi:hypothetical protein